MQLKRFGVSIPKDLLERFDTIVERKGYVGRSEAIRDAMRGYISQCEWEFDQEGRLATLNVVYQHKPRLMADLIEAQHNAKAHVLSTVHVHLTHSHCLETITVEGSKNDIQDLANRIGGLSGIEFTKLFIFSLSEKPLSGHSH